MTNSKQQKLPQLSEALKKEINFKVMESLKRFPEILNKLSFPYSLFLYNRFRIYFLVTNALYLIEQIKILDKKERMVIQCSDPLVIKFFEKDEHISFFSSKGTKKNFNTIFRYFLISVVRLIKSFAYTFKTASTYIVDSRDNYGVLLDKKSGKEMIGNMQLQYLYDELKFEDFALIDRFNIPKFNKNNQLLNFKKYTSSYGINQRINEDLILMKSLLDDPFLFKRSKKEVDLAFTKLDYSMCDSIIDKLFLHALINLKGSTSFFNWKEKAFTRFFRKVRPKKLVLIDEYSPNSRCYVNAARAVNVKVIGIQHGSMYELHPGYAYSEEEMRNLPVPDIFICWGSAWKEFLIKNGWKGETLKIGGHLRTDIIPLLKIKEKNSSKKHVVFASQPIRDSELRSNIAKEVFKAAKKLSSEINLTIRLHPSESDIDNFIAWAKEVNCTNYKFQKDGDLYRLLSNTDILITCFSTVGTEAIYFDIPLLIIDPLEQDISGYFKDGVASISKNADGLINNLLAVIEGDTLLSSDKIDNYKQMKANGIDGKTALRIKQIIESA